MPVNTKISCNLVISHCCFRLRYQYRHKYIGFRYRLPFSLPQNDAEFSASCEQVKDSSFPRPSDLNSRVRTLQNFVQIRGLKRPAINTSQLKNGRRTGGLAMKVGMLGIYDKWGKRYPVTVLQLDNCQVVQTKTEDTDGYNAVQLGVGEAKVKRVNKPLMGHFSKHSLVPNRKLMEFRVSKDCLLSPGTKIQATHFVAGQLVDVAGITKGKGFQGVVKRWGFAGGNASHGNSVSHRVPGSTGCRQDPGKVFKNKKLPGRMGGERVTMQNLKVLKVELLFASQFSLSVYVM